MSDITLNTTVKNCKSWL